MKLSIKEIILSGLFAALTAIGAQIAIPTPLVPITLQTLFVHLSGIILGKKCGALSQIILLLLGAIGLPVFSQFRGGLHMLVGPTGGYLISFPIVAFITGLLLEHKSEFKIFHAVGVSIIGLVICYAIGTIQLALAAGLDFTKALSLGVLPFIPFDIIKLVFASIIGIHVKKVLIKAKLYI